LYIPVLTNVFTSLVPEVAGTYANAGISAATNALNVGAAAEPVDGPASIKLAFWLENEIVVFKEVFCAVLVLDCSGELACTWTLVTVPAFAVKFFQVPFFVKH